MGVRRGIEDHSFKPALGISAAQKLIDIDRVDALFTEFTPVVLAVSPYLIDKNVLFVYSSPAVSPVENNTNAYKTFWDYSELCGKLGEKLNTFKTLGYIKTNSEFGDLCLSGLEQTYKGTLVIESHNSGETDFKTIVTKLKNKNVSVILNDGFSEDNQLVLKSMVEQGLNSAYFGICGDIYAEIISSFREKIKISCYGVDKPSDAFIAKIGAYSNKHFQTLIPAAISYSHMKQIIKSLTSCPRQDMECINNEMRNSKNDDTIGFVGFTKQIATYNYYEQVF